MATKITMRRGDTLTPSMQEHCKQAYPHRYTGDHKPGWARKEWRDGMPYPLQFKDDKEWLARTLFPTVNDRGRESWRHGKGPCWSHPSWPNNPELRVEGEVPAEMIEG